MKYIPQLLTTSEYSFMESAIQLENLIRFAKKNNISILSLTDHNNMHGTAEFLKYTKYNNIKAIIGLDLDVEDLRFILIAKNYKGYKEIIELSSYKMTNQNILIEDLKKYENIFILDHPRLGIVQKQNQYLKWDNFYYFDPNNNNKEDKHNIYLQECKILEKDDWEILESFSKINNITYEDHKFSPYLKEIENIPNNIVDNTLDLIEKINIDWPKEYPSSLPIFDKTRNADELLEEKVLENYQKEHKLFPDKQLAFTRIKYELEVIKKLNFSNYFLIIQDIVHFAKTNDISVGPARGSVAGSLIAFLLNITTINPLKYNLLFERFLNIDRVTMPDIDIDFQDDKRDLMLKYVVNKYGYNHMATISTFQRIGAKMAIRDIGRILNIKLADINNVSKIISNNESLEENEKNNSYFKRWIIQNDQPEFIELIRKAKQIEGFARQSGTHAAGIIITEKPVNYYIPICKSSENYLQSQYSMNFLEEFNLLKIDFLGLKTLTIIKRIEEEIKRTNNNEFWPEMKQDLFVNNLKKYFNNQKTNELLNRGDVLGIFQLESPGMINTIAKVKIDKFDDLVDIISLFRPGPIKNIDEYVKNKQNPNLIQKIDDEYDKIISGTNGIIIYQEQIMEIVQKYAKLSFSQADILRRVISKKDQNEMQHFKKIFIDNCKLNGKKEEIAEKIFHLIETFAQYGFNRSHSVAYSTLTYYMAQLKANFPIQFYTAILSSSDDQGSINKYVQEAKNNGINVESPNINYSEKESCFKNGRIYLPFSFIKGLGSIYENKIIEEREKNGLFTSFYNFASRCFIANIGDSIIDKIIKTNTLRDFYYDKNGKKIANMTTFLEAYKFEIQRVIEINTSKDENGNLILVNNFKEVPIEYKEANLKNERDYEIVLLGETYNSFPTLKFENKNNLSNLILDVWTKIVILVENKEEKKAFKTKANFLKLTFSDSTKKIYIVTFKNLNLLANLKEGQIIELEIKKFKNKKSNLEDYEFRTNYSLIEDIN